MNVAVDMPEASLYVLYKDNRTKDLRNQIVCQNLYLTEIIAKKLYPVYNSFAETEDMINCGVLALMSAVDYFDPAMGVKFETYASIRIRGAILDYIRKQNWIPRTTWERAKEIENNFSRLYSELGRDPSESEMAKALGVSESEYATRLRNANLYTIISYEEMLAENYAGIEEYEFQGDTPCYDLIEKENKEELIKALDKLSEKERLVVTLYYYEELKLKEIAGILNVSEARVCQINSKALMKLKTILSQSLI